MDSKANKGFTLIELMIVVAVIGILAAIAYPSYLDQARKTRRVDVEREMLEIVQNYERLYTRENSYTNAAVNKTSKHGHYTIEDAITSTASTYKIRAVPISGNDQENDSCGTLTINQKNETKPDGCW